MEEEGKTRMRAQATWGPLGMGSLEDASPFAFPLLFTFSSLRLEHGPVQPNTPTLVLLIAHTSSTQGMVG